MTGIKLNQFLSASLSLQTELNPQIIILSKAANEILKEMSHH